ncbi:Redox-sensitive transcriptional activator SoxR [Pelagimonas phthalicica]|uniref:Redox-sensitive transcriptional activator SoxR n=1 Tax=Pelagimonas phthalicica TaxID=1037362 RepID=A0A238JCA9_9RHOB|nr:helix-turn-helix domain-containing protein [Pelagimonas phthalicica]TDS93874.1 MerR family transcriptional regulator [Pelagimonas phthalicica]SMX27602.1 Redox-sensitive transcriptional activator SoxR [Pelagimonas phthalicica]
MELLDIGDVSERSGTSPSALRYYEKRGLIEAISRKGLRRQYEPSILPRLALIRLCQAAGFTLEETAEMLPDEPRFTLDRDKITARADDIDAQIEDLEKLSKLLRHIAKCTAPSHAECPNFQAVLNSLPHKKVPR